MRRKRLSWWCYPAVTETRGISRSSLSARVAVTVALLIALPLIFMVLLGGLVGGNSSVRDGSGSLGTGEVDTFPEDQLVLVCGDDEGAPNDLSGCSVGIGDAAFAMFGNDVRALTQPLINRSRTLVAFAERGSEGGTVQLRKPDGSADLTLDLPSYSGPLDWSDDERFLLVADRDALVVVDLLASREQATTIVERLELPPKHEVLGIAQFSPDASLVAVATKETDRAASEETYQVLLIDRMDQSSTVMGRTVVPIGVGRFTGTFADPAFDSTGERLAWAEGVTGTLHVFSLAEEEITEHPISDAATLVTGVSWSPTNLIAVGIDARLRLIDVDGVGSEVTSPLPADWSITASAPAWNAAGDRFATTVQHPGTEALLDLVLVDLNEGTVELLSSSSLPPPPISIFPGFPAWIN